MLHQSRRQHRSPRLTLGRPAQAKSHQVDGVVGVEQAAEDQVADGRDLIKDDVRINTTIGRLNKESHASLTRQALITGLQFAEGLKHC